MATGVNVTILYSGSVPSVAGISNASWGGTRVPPKKMVFGTIGTDTATTGNTITTDGNTFNPTQVGLSTIDAIYFQDVTAATNAASMANTARQFVLYSPSVNKVFLLSASAIATPSTVAAIASTAGSSFSFVAYGTGIDGTSTNTPV